MACHINGLLSLSVKDCLMRPVLSAKHLSHTDRNLLSVLCCFLIIAAMWLGVYLNNGSMVLAEPMETRVVVANGAIASQPTVMNDLKNRVKNDLDEKSDFAINHPSFASSITKKASLVKGQAKRSFDSPARQVKIAGDAAGGQTKENVAKIQGKAANAEGRVENAIEDVMSNIGSKVN
jgi:hypothetical protein